MILAGRFRAVERSPVRSTRYRSGSGQAGAVLWWQNRADYQIHATLDHAGARALSGEEAISLHQQLALIRSMCCGSSSIRICTGRYSRSHAADGACAAQAATDTTDGYTIDRAVEVEQGGQTTSAVQTVESDTRLQVAAPGAACGEGW